MSEYAETYRQAMRDKAKRMMRTDPHQNGIDASSWTPSEPMNADVQTGERPVSKQSRKRGGKVEGAHAKHRADRKPRKSGGRAIADAYVNRDVKEANEEREGIKHDGGFKHGGRPKRADGGSFVPTSRMAFQSGPSQMSKAAGLKHGGHADEAEDRKLVKTMVKKPALTGRKAGGSVSDGELEGMRPKGGREAHKHGGRADAHWIKGAIKHPGALHRELNVAEGKRIPEKKLEKAEHSKNKLVAKRAHLAETLEHMNREGRKKGGRAGKGKMNVNIIIGGGQGQQPQPTPMDAAPPSPHPPIPVPMPQAGPAPQGQPIPIPVPMGGAGGPPPMGGPPMMPRKRGGRADAGAGSGLGRLEKVRDYGRNARPTSEHY